MSARGRIIVALWLSAGPAGAYCRTTTCDPAVNCNEEPSECCRLDAEDCDTNGAPLYWPSSCVSYSVQEDGSSKQGISADVLSEVVDEALTQWLTAECGRDSPSLSVEFKGEAGCGRPEYNTEKKAKNANIWMFRDDATGNASEGASGQNFPNAIGVTTVTMDTSSGEILDVDVELLSGQVDFSVDDTDVRADLRSVVIHEAGHFLGLAHSNEQQATMWHKNSFAETHKRSLHQDDILGICAAYPADRDFPAGNTCEPSGGYSGQCYEGKGCGCAVPGSDRRDLGWGWGVIVIAGILGGRACRRRVSTS